MAKMENIKLGEISAVDHPAHMVEGYAILKATDNSKNKALLDALNRKEPMSEKTPADVLKELSVADILTALGDEKAGELRKALEPVATPTEEDVLKSLPESIRKQFEEQAAIVKSLNEQIEIEKAAKAEAIEKAANDEAIVKSKEAYTNVQFDHETVAPALRKFAVESPEAAESITKMLDAINGQAEGTNIFKTLGSDAAGDAGAKPSDKLEALAKARAEKDGVPFHKAYTDVVAENPELAKAHFEQENN